METLRALLVSVRPRQWVKNFFVFAGVVFAQKLFTPAFGVACAAFTIFCALSGAIYLLNDVADRERDRLDPKKCQRPMAAGRLGVGTATGTAVALIVLSLGAAVLLSWAFLLTAVAYAGLLIAYSVWLKQVVIVDVLVIAAGFVLRAVAGAVAINVEMSGWLLICTIELALFLALGKRRYEYLTLADAAVAHRPILAEYNPALLDQMIAVVTASTLTAYALYTMSPETVAKFHTRLLPATLVFVLYGIFRYLYLLYRRQLGGHPAELFMSDRTLLVNAVLWTLSVLLIIYGAPLE